MRKKKLLAGVMSAAIVMTCGITPQTFFKNTPMNTEFTASAANESLSLTNAEGKPGETVTVNVQVSCNNNFEALNAYINWDNPELILSKVSSSSAFVQKYDGDSSCGIIAYSNDKAIPDGDMITIKFKIPLSATPGTVYNISFGDILTFKEFNVDEQSIPTCTGGTITVLDNDEPSEIKGSYGYGIEWIYTNDGIVTISSTGLGTGEMSSSVYGESPFKGDKKIKSVIIEDGVNNIALSAFEGCTSLESVKMGKTVMYIGEKAFKNCTSLKSINISDSAKSIGDSAFMGCSSLENIKIPDSVTSIADDAFDDTALYENQTGVIYVDTWVMGCYGDLKTIELKDGTRRISSKALKNCRDLESIYIPGSVTIIDEKAFDGCSSLKSITVSEDNEVYSSIDGVLYEKDKTTLIKYPPAIEQIEYNIDNHAKKIADRAFAGSYNLQGVILPDSLTDIGREAFSDCQSLVDINIPDSVSHIGYRAFYYTPLLNNQSEVKYVERWIIECDRDVTSVELNAKTRGIADCAFKECKSIENVSMPETVKAIGEWAFEYCTALKSLTIPNSVKCIGQEAFYNCTALESINIPDSVENIENSTFQSCISLKNLNIPNSVKSIGENAFYGCESLESINIPNAVTNIESRTFYNCTALEEITISDSIKSIHYDAFENCENITNVIIADGSSEINSTMIGKFKHSMKKIVIPDSVESLGYKVFSDCSNLEIIIGIENTAITIDDLKDTRWYENNYTNVADGDVVYMGTAAVGFKGSISGNVDLVIKDGCESISPGAFYDNGHIISVTIPDSVKVIGEKAFYRCSFIEKITIGNVDLIDEAAFDHCTKLKKVSIDGGTIEKFAFCYCVNLESLELGENVKEIKKMAFTDSQLMESVYLPDKTILNSGAISSSCAALQQYIVNDTNPNYKTINGVLFDKSGTTLIAYPSSNCKYLGAGDDDNWVYSIPNGTKAIGAEAFWYSPYIDEIIVPDSVDSIGDLAFEHCTNLDKIVLPKKISAMGGGVFAECSSLKEIRIPEGVENFKSAKELRWSFGEADVNFFEGCTELESVILPKSLLEIGDKVFMDCYGIKKITVPQSVKLIGEDAFFRCSNLESITIENSECEIFDSKFTISNEFDGFTGTSNFNGIIYGHKNSTAQKYAEKYGYNFAVIGSEPVITTPTVTSVTTTTKTTTTTTKSTTVTTTASTTVNSSVSFPDYVEEYPQAIWLDSVSGKPGETVTVNLNVKCNNNLESFDTTIGWEDERLISTEAYSKGTAKIVSVCGKKYCTCIAYDDHTPYKPIPDGIIATIDFTIPDDAKDGQEYDIAFSSIHTFAIFGGDDLEDHVPHFGGKITVNSNEPTESTGSSVTTTVTTTSTTTISKTTAASGTTAAQPSQVMPGDVNNDGSVNLRDAVIIRRYIAGGWELEINKQAADVDKDGKITLKDATLIRRFIAGGWNVTL